MFLVLNLSNPEYMQPLYTTNAGKIMLASAACSRCWACGS